MMACAGGPNGLRWTIRPSSDPGVPAGYEITNFNGVLNSSLKGLYATDETGLKVLKATGNKTGGQIATAGGYTIEFANSTEKIAAKLVVIRK